MKKSAKFMDEADPLIDCLKDHLWGITKSHGQSTSKLIIPGEKWWDEATKPYNTRIEGRVGPLALVYPRDVHDITQAVACASDVRVAVTARSGGHSYGAYSLGGAVSSSSRHPSSSHHGDAEPNPDRPIPGEPSLVIDMRPFRSITYDPATEFVTVGPGALLGEVNELLEKNGRTVPSGSCPTVGIGGQALAGGFGLMSRSLGLLLDNLVEASVILANGDSVIASRTTNADLFWALRGAGPSFGIVHSLTFQTHPMPSSVQYFEMSLLPRALPPTQDSIARAARLYETFEEFGESEDAVPEWGMSWHVVPEPSSQGWGTKIEVLGQYHGSSNEFEKHKAKFLERLKVKGETQVQVGHRSLSFLESMHNVGGNWTRIVDRPLLNTNEHVDFYAKSILTKSPISRESITTQLSYLLALSPNHNPSTGTDWFILSPFLGGRESAVVKFADTQQSAFAHRDLRVVWELYAKHVERPTSVSHPADYLDLISFVHDMSDPLGPVQAVYPAYVDPQLSASQYPKLVWGDAYPKLQTLKSHYDPNNTFRFPQSVRSPTISQSHHGWELGSWIGQELLILFSIIAIFSWYRRGRKYRHLKLRLE